MAASGNGRTNQEAFDGVETGGWPPVVLLICGLKVRFLPGSPLSRNDLGEFSTDRASHGQREKASDRDGRVTVIPKHIPRIRF
jgi:hypothetical protein